MSFMETNDRFRKHQINIERSSVNQPFDHHFYEKIGLIDRMRTIKDNEEYNSLITRSQQPFQQVSSEDHRWLEGYAIGITPIRSKEHFCIIEFSLENGDFVHHPFALAKGMDHNYQTLLSVIDVMHSGKEVSGEILVKKCLLLVSFKMEEEKPLYFLHDVASKQQIEVNE